MQVVITFGNGLRITGTNLLLKTYLKVMLRTLGNGLEIAGRELQQTTLTGQKVDIDEAIRQAASWYTRNTVPTYSKVPLAIQALEEHRLVTSYLFLQKC